MSQHEKCIAGNDLQLPIASNNQSSVYLENETEEPSFLFNPPLYHQRYDVVQLVIEKLQKKINNIVDVGCAECKFLQRLKELPFVEHLIGVDIDKELLEKYKYRMKPMIVELLQKRPKDLTISFLCGNIADRDERLSDCDVITLVEVIEHLYDETIERMRHNIFGHLQPKMVIFTTPNKEFNVIFPNFSGCRHWDHKFEWTRAQFQEWCDNVCREYDYSVTYDGIGEAPEGRESVGHCSQMAVFERVGQRVQCSSNQCYPSNCSYEEIFSVVYPGHNLSKMELLNCDVHYYINNIAYAQLASEDVDDLTEVPVSLELLNMHGKLCEQLDINSLTEKVSSLGYKLSENRTCVLVNCERPESSDQFTDEEQLESSMHEFESTVEENWD